MNAIESTVRIHSLLAAQSGRQRELSQHAPRPARVRFSVQTAGIGEARLVGKKAIDFGAYMLEEPGFTWGVVALDSMAVGELPLCTAIVIRYKRTTSGLYTGAEMAFRTESAKTNIRLKFSLIYEGSTLRSTTGTGTGDLDAPRGTNVYRGTPVDPSTL